MMDRKIEKKKWTPKKVAFLMAAGLFVGFSIYGFWKDSGVARLNVETAKLTISRVERGPFLEFIPVRGAVLPGQTIYLDALEGGQVEEIHVEEGSMVHKGDAILKLANADLQLQVMSREEPLEEQLDRLGNARLEMAQKLLKSRQSLMDIDFQLQQKRRRYEKYSSLSEKDLVAVMPRADFEQLKDEYEYRVRLKEITLETHRQDSLLAQMQIEQLAGTIERMQRNFEIVRQRLEALILRAPISGQLTMLNAEIGESKSRGERLGQVDVLDRFKVRAAIDEFYIARIQKGQRGEFDLSGETYGLVIVKVYPQVRDGRFEIDLEFDGNPPQGIRRGQTLQIRLELGDLEEALLLARGGFYQKTGGNWVYVLDGKEERAVKRPVKIGRQNPRFFEVIEGLEAGEKVITSSYDNFGEMDVLVLK